MSRIPKWVVEGTAWFVSIMVVGYAIYTFFHWWGGIR